MTSHERVHSCRLKKELVPMIIEKGLLATKSSTKTRALEALLAYVYIDTPDYVVVRDISECLIIYACGCLGRIGDIF